MEINERTIQSRLYYDNFGSFSFLIPNYTPFGWWECDMFGLTKSGYMREWEIKLTVSDFKADKKKGRHYMKRKEDVGSLYTGYRRYERKYKNKHEYLKNGSELGPKQFYYITPKDLIKPEDVPEYAGLIYCNQWYEELRLDEIKKAPVLHKTKVDKKVIAHIGSIMYYRYWRLRNEIKRNKE